MPWHTPDYISLPDLYLAYRKAKVDMFYEREHPSALAFCEFEKRLTENLAELHVVLNAPEPDWMANPRFVGGYAYVPKSISPPEPEDGEQRLPQHNFFTSDPDTAWRDMCLGGKAEVKCRIVGRHPVAFHVISALWIQKVGHLYDGLLDEHAYGSRVRRARSEKGGVLPRPSVTSMGNFRPYTFGFLAWRARGLSAMREALEKEKSILALTADLRSFYHEVSASYLVSPEFLNRYPLRLTDDDQIFTTQLVHAFQTWAANTPDHAGQPDRGVPVGLSAARVIANAILVEFDRFIIRELAPIYYGRYVDDVFLVLDNQHQLHSADEVWSFLIGRSGGLLRQGEDNRETVYWLDLPYSRASRLRFAGDKQRIFALEPQGGQTLLDSISKTITERSSDWRLLPDLPRDARAWAADFLAAGRDATEEVDNLRKSDGVSVRRLAFALRLRNLEAVERDLRPSVWKDHRDEFFRLALNHIVTLPGVFAYAAYIPRLVGVAAACGDWENARQVVDRLIAVFRLVRETSNAKEEQVASAEDAILNACFEATVKALSRPSSRAPGMGALLEAFRASRQSVPPEAKLRELAQQLFLADLARDAFRDAWLDEELGALHLSKRIPSLPLPEDVRRSLYVDDVRAFMKACAIPPSSFVPQGLLFPTRPLNPAEIALLDQRCLFDSARFRRWVRALRGTEIGVPREGRAAQDTKGRYVNVELREPPQSPVVAVPCFHTREDSWRAAVSQTPDPDYERYFRLNHLVNDILVASPRPHYLILPELALPGRWFNRLAHRLTQSGISLIAGLEYLHWSSAARSGKSAHSGRAARFVSNQVHASLVTDVLGYRSHMIYVQEKARAAPEEARLLADVGGVELRPRQEPRKPVIRHGEFFFGILICSELTNIEFRQPYRGKVDALLIPEWNQDTNSFGALIEASALDTHCFVVQVNNGKYGDCRIRAPYKDEYRRDVARVKGGEADYFVLGRIEVMALRAFQSHHRSPQEGPFKPTPDGFEIDADRFVRPD